MTWEAIRKNLLPALMVSPLALFALQPSLSSSLPSLTSKTPAAQSSVPTSTVTVPTPMLWFPSSPASSARPTRPSPPPHSPPTKTGTSYELLSCLAKKESNANYQDDTGNGYHGAYQFLQSTWDAVARHVGRPDLVGVNPAHVAPATQDMLALALLQWCGLGQWPVSGRYCNG